MQNPHPLIQTDLLQPLWDAGLIVQFSDPEEVESIRRWSAKQRDDELMAWMFSVRKPPEHPTFNRPPEYTRSKDYPKPLDFYRSTIYYNFVIDTWVYRNRESLGPSIREHEFQWHSTTLSAIVAAILTYYFGQPTVIAGWQIPAHRHPELTDVLHRLPALIAGARRCSPATMATYRHDLWDHRPPFETIGGYPYAYLKPLLFLTCPATDGRAATLHLRRDFAEAWIVEDENGSDHSNTREPHRGHMR